MVTGDVVLLSEGDRVAADAWLLRANNLLVDESLLTGEALPVGKAAGTGDPSVPPAQLGGENLPWLYAGTFIVRGQGYAQVTATGGRSQVGRIGRSLGQTAAGTNALAAADRTGWSRCWPASRWCCAFA